MSIFADFAPLYWDAGLPVIPLKPFDNGEKGAGKAPVLNDWTKYGAQAPTEVEKQAWLRSYPNHNIGLPFGAASGLCAVDIDTEDEGLIKAILEILPATPWTRIGAKGMGLIYKWNGQRNFKLRGEEGGMLLEFLGMGNQMVVPPSIHPTTCRPYKADNHLYEVMDKILGLPLDIDQQLRELLGTKGFAVSKGTRSGPVDVVPEGERDVQMVRHAGYLARVVLGMDKANQFSLGEAIEQMTHWVRSYTASVSGDDMGQHHRRRRLQRKGVVGQHLDLGPGGVGRDAQRRGQALLASGAIGQQRDRSLLHQRGLSTRRRRSAAGHQPRQFLGFRQIGLCIKPHEG